ncbi:SpoIID/LytB domain-containing protein [Gordonia aurantiaca]|uniref:SpoIID/LytB domain-containing protein n=1 Tax=Gordonia sp. B21 TaxID=3151852 RepID=UPI003264356D
MTWAAAGLAPALLAGGLVAASSLDSASEVELSVGSTVTLIGHGHGHGRGMGQWGAYGYARKGWSAQQILRHFYGGTTAGKVDRPEIDVTLTGQSSVNVHADAGMRVGGQTVAPGQAVSLSGGTASIRNGCGGAVVRTVPATFVEPLSMAPNRPPAEFLKFCGSEKAYRGALGVEGGRVVNRIHIDDYVKGVIPRESLPAWADSGGAAALQAQAVAARTYALAAIAGGKKIDDTQNSQVYGGVSGEDRRTNAAADATAGQILLQNGQPAFTEFSASTGGYSAGGRFPAVVDEGDTVSPNHNWTATVSAASIGSAFGVGALRSFEVIEANGLGPEHGRALKVRAIGSGGTAEVSGEEARTKLQLKSSWFSVQGQANPPRIVKPPTGPAGPGFGLDFGSLNQLAEQLVPGSSKLLELAAQAMNGRFTELGGVTGPLGAALGVPTLTPDAAGVTQLFEKGMMFFTPATGAKVLVGKGLERFQQRGGIPVLGFPKRDSFR